MPFLHSCVWLPEQELNLRREGLQPSALPTELSGNLLELAVGLEPTTNGVQNHCSTIELRQHGGGSRIRTYGSFDLRCSGPLASTTRPPLRLLVAGMRIALIPTCLWDKGSAIKLPRNIWRLVRELNPWNWIDNPMCYLYTNQPILSLSITFPFQ